MPKVNRIVRVYDIGAYLNIAGFSQEGRVFNLRANSKQQIFSRSVPGLPAHSAGSQNLGIRGPNYRISRSNVSQNYHFA